MFSRINLRHIVPLGALLSLGALAVVWVSLILLHDPQATSGVSQNTRTVTAETSLLKSQWSYIPGITGKKEGLYITATNKAIVEQDGTGGQANPPVNLYGVHIEEATNFTISMVAKDIKGTAAIQLYGQVPIIADEFRIERKSIRLGIAPGELRVDLWDGSGQQPAVAQRFTMQATPEVRVTVEHRNDTLTFKQGSTVVASMAAKGIFADRKAWFGLDATQSWLLTELKVRPLDNQKLEVADSSTLKIPATPEALQVLASRYRPGFTIGAAIALGPAATDVDYAKVAFSGNFGALTTENALKWQSVHPKPSLYTFEEADALVALAKKHHMSVNGHTLVFGEANPSWVTSLPTSTQTERDKVGQVMRDHITKVAGHYKGKVATWDVVNEPLADYDNFDVDAGKTLRNHVWYRAMGESYMADAFRTAKAADPDAQLFINEYGLEEDGERWDVFLALVKKLKAQGVPIDGVGFQSHVYAPGDRISASQLRKHIQALASLGLKSRISEIDVYSYQGQSIQAKQYTDVLRICIAEPSCISYTTWGVSDRYNTYKDDDGTIQYGQDFLWTAAMEPTPAVQELRQSLQK